MKKLGLTLAMAVVNTVAWAGWVEIGSNESGTFYVDPPSMQRTGDIVKMWYLIDFKTIQVDNSTRPFLSTKDQSEYDCKEVRARTIYYNNYSGPMGRGKITFTLKDPLKWRQPETGTIASTLLKIACGKK
jgi:hypothetical protein